MEQNNEPNQNQASIPETVPVQNAEKVWANTFDKTLEAFKQNFLADLDTKIDQKLSQIFPKTAEEGVVNTSTQDEIAFLKNELSQVKKVQQSLGHHDLGSGQIGNRQLDDTKTLRQHLQEDSQRG